MATALTFTDSQQVELEGIAADIDNVTTADPSKTGAYVPLYQRIIEMIEENRVTQNLENDEQVNNALEWFKGALNVNNDEGYFNQLIRKYNVRQGELWFDQTFSPSLIQTASNAVGQLIAGQILRQGELKQKLPTVQEIGVHDLNGVRDKLYDIDGLTNADMPLSLNQAWPGIILLGVFDDTNFAGRVLQVNAVDEVKLDTLLDLKHSLFAWDAFNTAFKDTAEHIMDDLSGMVSGSYFSPALFVSDFLTNEVFIDELLRIMGLVDITDAIVDSFIAATTGDVMSLDDMIHETSKIIFSQLIDGQRAENPAAVQILELVSQLGSESVLDMLDRVIHEGSFPSPTTVDNFQDRAQSLLNYAAGIDETNTTIKQLFETEHDTIEDVIAKASLNNATGLAYRNALKSLSFFVVLDLDLSSREGLSLIDEFTGMGSMSDEYINDRVHFLNVLYRTGKKDVTVIFTGDDDAVYTDTALDIVRAKFKPVTVADPLPNPSYISFSSSEPGDASILRGGSQADRLYGFQGNDTLFGGVGEKEQNGVVIGDYLEGGDGNDFLYHNDSSRVDDNQKDILKGGFGKDIYYVGNNDEITDADRSVEFIEFNTVLIGGAYEEDAPGYYKHQTNDNLTLNVVGNDAVISLSSDATTVSFTIKSFKRDGYDFNDGDFGITLNELPPPPANEFNATDNDELISVTNDGLMLKRFDNPDAAATDEVTYTSPITRILGKGGDDTILVQSDIH